MVTAEQLVGKLLEAVPPDDQLDWTSDPQDPDELKQPAQHPGLDDAVQAQKRAALEKQLHKAFKNAFMKPEIEESDYYEVETRAGTYIVPSFVHNPGDVPDSDVEQEAYDDFLAEFEDYVEGDPEEVSKHHGFVYRVSAPGYLDASEWSAVSTEEEAMENLLQYYGDDDGDDIYDDI